MSLPWIRLWESPSTPSVLRLALARSRQYLCSSLVGEAERLWLPKDDNRCSVDSDTERASRSHQEAPTYHGHQNRRGREGGKRSVYSDRESGGDFFSFGAPQADMADGLLDEEKERNLENYTEWALRFRDEVEKEKITHLLL